MASPGDATRRAAGVWRAFASHGADVFRFVHRRCGDAAMAEEITQDVFVAALEAHGFDDAPPIEWLYRVARNRMIDVLRREQNYETKLRLVAGHTEDEGHEPATVDRVRVAAAVAALTALHRTVLMLRYVDDMSVRELAESLGRSERGVEALLMRARAALRHEIEGSDG